MFLKNHIIFIPLITWFITQSIKFIIFKFQQKKRPFITSGGMPSSHASVTMSLLTTVTLQYGIFHDITAITCMFTAVVIYDSMNVRYEVSKHAKTLNKIEKNNQYNEYSGHTPLQVFIGTILGIILGFILYQI